MKKLYLDFETFNTFGPGKRGVYQYHRSHSCRTLCMAYAFDDSSVRVWQAGESLPDDVRDYLAAGGELIAHNAAFERLHLEYVFGPAHGLPQIDSRRWVCTATQARARALPGSLDGAARALGLPYQKDRRGQELIKLLCMPNECNDDPDLMEELVNYCVRDVEVMRALHLAIPPLTAWERQVYAANEAINDAGLPIDVDLASAAAAYADAEVEEINARLAELTAGRITTVKQHQRIKDILLEYGGDDARRLMTRVTTDRRSGEEQRKLSFDADTRQHFLAAVQEDPGRFPPLLVSVAELVDEAGGSSTSKFSNMASRAEADGRVRGAYICFGAGQTGRFSSTGVQMHNLPRKANKNPDVTRRWILEDRELPGGVMSTLASMLRPAIRTPSERDYFVCYDWSAIEARVLPWLSYSDGGDRVLSVFAAADKDKDVPDIYEIEAANLFGCRPEDVTKEQRAVGKVEVLSMGYQGGRRAFQAMARGYGISVSDDRAEEIKIAWRGNNQWAVYFWEALQEAATNAVLKPGTPYDAGLLTYYSDNGWLFCQLPSGRILSYPRVRADYGDRGVELSALKASWKPKAGENEWPRVAIYGGLLAENATQAAAADLLHTALVCCVGEGLPVIGHTHDEILCMTRDPDRVESRLRDIMLDVPHWAEGLPLAAEGWRGRTYRK